MRTATLRGLGLALFLAIASLAGAGESGRDATPCRRIEVFVREGCPHCAAGERFLEDLAASDPGLELRVRDISKDATALADLAAVARERSMGALSVPTFVLCDQLVVGFDRSETTGREIRARLAGGDPVRGEVVVPLLGTVALDRLGLPIFTIVLGLVDGFNPCAMWVLLFLLSILVNLRDRRRIAMVAGTFVLVSGLAYFAFMAAWLEVFRLVGLARPVQIGIGVVALGVGAIHVKDFFALHRGPSLSIPDSAKPGIYARVRRVVTAEHLPAALASAVVLAVAVNVVELLCTAGIPAVYTEVLALRGLGGWERYAYLALYNLAYVLDDAAMVTLAVVTLGKRRLEEGEGRFLKLVSGVVIALLGALLIAAPQLLTGG